MEDAVLIHDNVAGNACFAVFDGHGGEQATLLAKHWLPDYSLSITCNKTAARRKLPIKPSLPWTSLCGPNWRRKPSCFLVAE